MTPFQTQIHKHIQHKVKVPNSYMYWFECSCGYQSKRYDHKRDSYQGYQNHLIAVGKATKI